MKRRLYKLIILILVTVSCLIASAAAVKLYAGGSILAKEVAGEEVLSVGEVRVPILMYHNIRPESNSRYCVTPAQLESDFSFLKANGFQSIFISDLVEYVRGGGTLPKKPVVITFDDGHYNNLYYGLPLAEKYDMKLVFNIIGAFSQHSTESGDHSNVFYSHLTWAQIKFLASSGRVEIGSHTWNMHNYKPRFGVSCAPLETACAYENALKDDFTRLQTVLQEKCGVTPKVFAYPFGKYTKESEKVLLELGFTAMLTTNEGINVLKRGDEAKLYKLKRLNRESYYSTEKVASLLFD